MTEMEPTHVEGIKTAIEWRMMIETLMGPGLMADMVLKGGIFVNVVTREIYPADVAIARGRVLLVGDVRSVTGPRTVVEDVSGKYVCPGFIDAHMHFESSMLTATEFTRLSLPTGTTTVVADPHEIGNVLGLPGMQAMIEEARRLPHTVRFAVPCWVPDVPGLETSGEVIGAKEIAGLLRDPGVQGIGEIQGFSNVGPVYEHRPETVDDLLTAVTYALSLGKTVEGNAPGLFGKELAAHIIGGGSNISCHETTTKEEAMEKLRNGVFVYMREGSSQHDMPQCIRAVTEEGLDSRYAVLVSDDMVAEDLMTHGHMNDLVRRTVHEGVDPVEAIQMVTINPAAHFGFLDRGMLTPGKRADITVVNSLTEMTVYQVYSAGKKVAENGNLLIELPSYRYPETVRHSMKRTPVSADELAILVPAPARTARVRALVLIPNENLTEATEVDLTVDGRVVQPAPQSDVIPIVVAERHGKSGRIGKAFLKGMGLKRGAIAESVSHDTHNIICCGANYQDMAVAINHVIAMGGGVALVQDEKVLGDLPLPVGGLITDELTGSAVAERIQELYAISQRDLGTTIAAPLMHLSFLSLATSPKWKITDAGLVDVDHFEVLPVLIS